MLWLGPTGVGAGLKHVVVMGAARHLRVMAALEKSVALFQAHCLPHPQTRWPSIQPFHPLLLSLTKQFLVLVCIAMLASAIRPRVLPVTPCSLP